MPVAKRRGRGLDVWPLSSMMVEVGASVWGSKFLTHAMVDGATYKDSDESKCTMARVWHLIRWLLRVLLSGKWPSRDWDGKPMKGWR